MKTHYRSHYGVAPIVFIIGVSTIGRSIRTDDILVRIKECTDIRIFLVSASQLFLNSLNLSPISGRTRSPIFVNRTTGRCNATLCQRDSNTEALLDPESYRRQQRWSSARRVSLAMASTFGDASLVFWNSFYCKNLTFLCQLPIVSYTISVSSVIVIRKRIGVSRRNSYHISVTTEALINPQDDWRRRHSAR